MNFFKSILSDDPEPEEYPQSDPDSPSKPDPHPSETESESESTWSFGGFMKTLTTRSESVIETYRRDLDEFRSGLKKETELLTEVASRAVKDLPADIIKSTADIISHGKDTLLMASSSRSPELDNNNNNNNNNDNVNSDILYESRPYSRFEERLRLLQSDAVSFCEEPEDVGDYNEWKMGFLVEEKREEIEELVEEGNGDVANIFRKVVPNDVDEATFWCRYFYRVFKLKQQEDLRANIVKRAIAVDDEEELSWDVDDDDDEVEGEEYREEAPNTAVVEVGEVEEKRVNSSNVVEQSGEVVDEEVKREDGSNEVVEDLDGKVERGESCKEIDVSVMSTPQKSSTEEDLEWDEIEDMGSGDEKEISQGGSSTSNKDDSRKRLSAAEEDEDLSWDIEDDDEPANADNK